MVLNTKIDPISRDLQIMVDETLSPRARSRAFADYAKAELVDAQEVNARALGSVPPHKTFVDGRPGAPLESVHPDTGHIRIEFLILNDVLEAVATLLYFNSPVGDPENGHYRDFHVLFADGSLVPIVSKAPSAREYVFLNTVPYARKIEVGAMKMQVPGTDHVYERTRQTASRRYSKLATVRLSYRAVAGSKRVPALTITPK